MNRDHSRHTSSLTAVVVLGLVVIAATALAQDPYARPDDTWISISGTVESVERDQFELDYGDGMVTVEMDDGDRDADAYKLLQGDKVTVHGMIDDDFFEATSIEASSVYVEKLGTYFYASAVDEEDDWVYVTGPVVVSETVLEGTVTKVNDDDFVIDNGYRSLTVEVDEMPYDPLDDIGYQHIDEGDRLRITGDMEYNVFDEREFEAHSIVTLAD